MHEPHQHALVLRVDRAGALIEPIEPRPAGDPVRHREHVTWGPDLLAAIARDPAAHPCAGDRVLLRRGPDGPLVVQQVLPRWTLLARAEPSGLSEQQNLAANMDVVAAVESLLPAPQSRRLDRLLALAWTSGADPVVLLTKADLVPDAADRAAELGAQLACPVLPISTVTGDGLAEVAALLTGGRVMALLGASGVGKSSLVNALSGGVSLAVQDVRRDGKGRHTTVTRELHRLPDGAVIDTPGLRGVGLLGGEGVDRTFPDVVALAAACRFADCRHQGEPGCAVQDAVAAGELAGERVRGWRKLQAEGRRQEMRRDARLRAEEGRRIRALHRAMRGQYRP